MPDAPLNLAIDIETLTIGELEEIEDITGLAFGNIDWAHLSARLMRALVYIVARRDNPDFTVEDARNVRLTQLKKPSNEAVEDTDPMTSLSANGVA